MRNSGDFVPATIDTVRSQAALIPAVIFDGWKKATPGMVSPYELLTKALADFYTTPNRANYEVILGIEARSMLAAAWLRQRIRRILRILACGAANGGSQPPLGKITCYITPPPQANKANSIRDLLAGWPPQ
jgi:hypothetical protein